jgi:hypothetical protein
MEAGTMTVGTLPSGNSTAFDQSAQRETNPAGTAEGLYFVLAPRDDAADWHKDCLERVDHLRTLQWNWDSYGANPVNVASIEIAKQLIRSFADVIGIGCPRVEASPAGYVSLSWEWQEHSRELDLEIRADGTLQYSYIDEKEPSSDREGTTADPNLIACLLTGW